MTAPSIAKASTATPSLPMLPALPTLFVLTWSTGYIVGKIGLPYAGPFTLLFLRFGVAALILLAVALVTRAPWPATRREFGHLAVVGLLLQALQFAGLYSALKLGVSAGVSALVVGTMPVFTALGAALFLGEKTSTRQWIGLAGGLCGVALVVADKVGTGGASLAGIGSCLLALAGITLGTLYQKRYCAAMDLRTGGFVQLFVASMVACGLSLGFEGFAVEWTPRLLFASTWLSTVNSIGSISLLFVLMRKGEASKVASLFYLIPGVTACMGYVLLGETLRPMALAGFLVTGGAVYVCTRNR
ncbi:DMT family transporter [Massilia sp. Se16.2.3]|uniref:DMT family transporter n=1 Tax=Massilia sp. Se16.2.3 TaxID=2709303 RepID=UPI001600CD94|nr:EamA family transporter [Massilia sp. Se16.2.3]QNA98845.1 EamA family transporter [Massilia sp. Se16.2.3]